jgi:hypothetical protein
MEARYWRQTALPSYPGFVDTEGKFVPFSTADEVFKRARRLQTRVLLRLQLNEQGQLEGMLYTHAKGLGVTG